MSEVGAALIGPSGMWGPKIADAAERAGNLRLVTCYGRDEERRRVFADERGIEAAESFEAAVEHPEVEAVLLVTPNDVHAEQALACAERGRHVFVEKPIADTVAAAERIRDAIVAYAGGGKDSRFLELGVGTGRIALPFIRGGYDYTGVDISRAMMDRLAAKIAADPSAAGYRYDLREADVAALPFADGSFDVAITVHVLHLVADWQAVVREARRVPGEAGDLPGHDRVEGHERGAQAREHPVREQRERDEREVRVAARDEGAQALVERSRAVDRDAGAPAEQARERAVDRVDREQPERGDEGCGRARAASECIAPGDVPERRVHDVEAVVEDLQEVSAELDGVDEALDTDPLTDGDRQPA